MSGTLLAIALGSALQLSATPPTQHSPASKGTETNAVPPKPVEPQPAPQQKVQVAFVPPAQNVPVSNTTGTNFIQFRMMELQPAAQKNVQIERVGGMSSRSWTEIVGWHPGVSQFTDAENHEPQALFSVSFGPKTRQQ
ncbi:MAG TPA: hypothetical protein VFY06_06715 [Verrucomicrobiae bacterium]|nr:hypothetical protein [Verrucomicrobiae bacterium]